MTLLCMFCITLCGCSASVPAITKENSTLTKVTLKELTEKIKEKKDFVLLVTQNESTDSELMKRTILPYARSHKDLNIVELTLDEQGDKLSDTQKAYHRLQEIVPAFSGSVPQVICFQGGKMKETKSGVMSEIGWQNFLIGCELVKGDVIKEKTKEYELETSKYMKVMDVNEIADKIRRKESFYLYQAYEDRYNEAFSKTLKKYSETAKQEIIVMNGSDIIQPSNTKEQVVMQESMQILNTTLNNNISPAILRINRGKVEAVLKDNVELKEVEAWFKEHAEKK